MESVLGISTVLKTSSETYCLLINTNAFSTGEKETSLKVILNSVESDKFKSNKFMFWNEETWFKLKLSIL